jgi:anthranilate phosphoribosyltransferase
METGNMIKEMIQKAVTGNDLAEEEMVAVMNEIMEGLATDAQIGAFITALRVKGETIFEITGAARVMREKATRIEVNNSSVNIETVLDTCGTGGDESNTFNVSTTAAFVVAGGGVAVAKHGNRSVSSQCGSADVLASLGVNLDVTPDVVADCIRTIGIGFLYAPKLHGAMKYAIGPRREIGIRTIYTRAVDKPCGGQCSVAWGLRSGTDSRAGGGASESRKQKRLCGAWRRGC